MFEISRDTMISEILSNAPEAMPVFQNIGMHCLGCPASRGETIEEACAVHGTDADELMAKINEFLAAKAAGKN